LLKLLGGLRGDKGSPAREFVKRMALPAFLFSRYCMLRTMQKFLLL
jgi:hypothetical protein